MKKTGILKKRFAAVALAAMMIAGALPMAKGTSVYAASTDAAGAKKIALKEAGFKSGSVKKLSCKLDRDDNEYVVKFCKGKYTYRYEIKKSSGKVSEMSRKLTSIKKTASGKEISKKKAASIAYKFLGISKGRDLEREKDRYYGAKVWEVSFDKGAWDYEFKIDRRSGKILYYEKSRD